MMNVIRKVRLIGLSVIAVVLLVVTPLLASQNYHEAEVAQADAMLTALDTHEQGNAFALAQKRQASLNTLHIGLAAQVTALQREVAAKTAAEKAAQAKHDAVVRDTNAHARIHAEQEAAVAKAQQRINYLMREIRRYESTLSRVKAAYLARQRAIHPPTPTSGSIAALKSWARIQVGDYQFQFLDNLWTKESGWRWNADNPSSDAYGIPQALPGSKMASAGADWATNPYTQIRWGLGYIASVYGTCEAAWAHSVQYNWY